MFIPLTTYVTVSVEYNHSVSLTRVVDTYRVNQTGIYAIEERWQDFFAGQPLEGEIENGFAVKKLNAHLGQEWKYWFISMNDFKLYINDELVYVQPSEDGFLTFRVERVPVIVSITG